MRLASLVSRFAVLLAGSLAFAACGENLTRNTSDEDEDADDWICNEQRDGTRCSCELLRGEGDIVIGGAEQVDVCQEFGCCLFSEEASEFSLATCECLETQDCAAEAASRPGTAVVPACPPGSDPTLRCAAPDENCRDDYLAANDLVGCCAGTVCRNNDAGIPVCLFPSTEEAACLAFAAGSETAALDVTASTLDTSLGTLELDTIYIGAGSLATGSDGCLGRVQMDFVGSDQPSGCVLSLMVEISAGMITATSFAGELSDCEGNSGEDGEGTLGSDAYVSGFTFTGTWCERGEDEGYCYAGSFEWAVTAPSGPLTFENQRLVAEGLLCSTENSGTCG